MQLIGGKFYQGSSAMTLDIQGISPITKDHGKGKGKTLHLPKNPESFDMKKALTQFKLVLVSTRITKFMKQGRYVERIGGGALTFLAAVMQQTSSENMDQAVRVVNKTRRIKLLQQTS